MEGLVHSPPKESKPRVSEKLAAFREQRAQRTELALLSLPELPQDVAAEVLRAAWQMANFGSTKRIHPVWVRVMAALVDTLFSCSP